MQYRVVQGSNILELSRKVMELSTEGWQLQGGVSHDGRFYLQAMTKRGSGVPPLGGYKQKVSDMIGSLTNFDKTMTPLAVH